MIRPALLALTLALLSAGCGPGQSGLTGGNTGRAGGNQLASGLSAVPSSPCSTGVRWSGTRGSTFAHPCEDCIGCHTRERCKPSFILAGTVSGSLHEADDCAGVNGVTVQVTDATGAVTQLLTNSAGNFFTEAPVALPYRIKLINAAGTREMLAPQSSGQCASCHTTGGINGAPGRILAP